MGAASCVAQDGAAKAEDVVADAEVGGERDEGVDEVKGGETDGEIVGAVMVRDEEKAEAKDVWPEDEQFVAAGDVAPLLAVAEVLFAVASEDVAGVPHLPGVHS